MTTTLIRNCRLSHYENLASISISDGMIDGISNGENSIDFDLIHDLDGAFVSPGYVDVHNHGAVGVDVNTATADELLDAARFLARNGVTAWMPTLVPDSDVNYLRAIKSIDELILRQGEMAVAQAVGVHYEGVFASVKICGALRPEYFRSGQWSVAGGQLPRLKSGLHMTTLAPEIDEGIDLTRELVKNGWIVSIGHTKADTATLDAAFSAGARHLTHFFNAMTGFHHREVGVAGWGLANRDVTFDIIADGVHVHPKMLELACRVKGSNKVSLISDSVAPTGLGDGEFELWGETIAVVNGKTQNERGSIAGSVITMHDAVKQMRTLGFSNGDLELMASLNPARLLGIDADRGSIDIGKRADLVAVDADGEIKMTMIGGKIVE